LRKNRCYFQKTRWAAAHRVFLYFYKKNGLAARAAALHILTHKIQLTMHKTLISAAELRDRYTRPDYVVIDCRFDLFNTAAGRGAYLQGHIPGAIYAHLDEDLSGPVRPGLSGRHPLPEVAVLAQKLGSWGIDAHKQVVVYDAQAGAIAARLWWMLRWLGHEAVAVLDGGWPAWLAAGGPADAAIPVPVPAVFAPHPRPDSLVDAAGVDLLRHDPAFLLLDARSPERFRGEEEPIDPIAGHIDGAINAPLGHNLAEGRFRSAGELRQLYQSLLAGRPASQAVCYCGSGVSACHNILAMVHAGLGEPRLYPGSWSEWIHWARLLPAADA